MIKYFVLGDSIHTAADFWPAWKLNTLNYILNNKALKPNILHIASEFHLPTFRIQFSEKPCCAACVAAPNTKDMSFIWI